MNIASILKRELFKYLLISEAYQPEYSSSFKVNLGVMRKAAQESAQNRPRTASKV